MHVLGWPNGLSGLAPPEHPNAMGLAIADQDRAVGFERRGQIRSRPVKLMAAAGMIRSLANPH